MENVHIVEVANLGIGNNEINGSDSVSSSSGTGSGGAPAGFPFQVGYREAAQDYTLYLLAAREEERSEWIRAIRSGYHHFRSLRIPSFFLLFLILSMIKLKFKG